MAFLLIFLLKVVTAGVIGSGIIWLIRTIVQRKITGPPGPIGLPILGYLPFFSFTKKSHLVFNELAERYGDVYYIQMGQLKQLVLNSDDAIREAFKEKDLSGRPTNSPSMDIIRDAGERNLIFANGERWRYSRNLALRGLSLFSASRASRMESSSNQVANWLYSEFANAQQKPIKTRPLLIKTTGAFMISVLFGAEPNPGSSFMSELVDAMQIFFDLGQKTAVVELFPALKPFYTSTFKEVSHALAMYITPVRGLMLKHKSGDGELRTIGDAINKALDEGSSDERMKAGMTLDDVRDIVLDMFDAGFFTISETLEWILLLTASYPEVQRRVHKEIDACLNEDHRPEIADIKRMPYIRAVLQETLRWSSSVALGVAHSVVHQTTFRGWTLESGTQLIPNQYAANHDPKTWPEPDKFDPNRFLQEDGSFNQRKAEQAIVFSVGKRRCPGEQLAINETFLIYTFLLGQFEVLRDPVKEKKDPLDGGPPWFTHYAGEHKLVFKERQSV
jgi:cytochrome P450